MLDIDRIPRIIGKLQELWLFYHDMFLAEVMGLVDRKSANFSTTDESLERSIDKLLQVTHHLAECDAPESEMDTK